MLWRRQTQPQCFYFAQLAQIRQEMQILKTKATQRTLISRRRKLTPLNLMAKHNARALPIQFICKYNNNLVGRQKCASLSLARVLLPRFARRVFCSRILNRRRRRRRQSLLDGRERLHLQSAKRLSFRRQLCCLLKTRPRNSADAFAVAPRAPPGGRRRSQSKWRRRRRVMRVESSPKGTANQSRGEPSGQLPPPRQTKLDHLRASNFRRGAPAAAAAAR